MTDVLEVIETIVFTEPEMAKDLRYPIGEFSYGSNYTEEEIETFINRIETLPARLKKLVAGVSNEILETKYRDGSWTVRQVIHHLPDSHMNAYIRFKLALTEDRPTIKPYNQEAWAEMIDSKTMSPEVSLALLTAVHQRWSTILKAMNAEDFNRTYFHPEHMQLHPLSELIAMYAWHGDNHLAQIASVIGEKKIAAAPKKKIAVVKKTKAVSVPKKKVKKAAAKK